MEGEAEIQPEAKAAATAAAATAAAATAVAAGQPAPEEQGTAAHTRRLLAPLARSILRDLRAEAAGGAPGAAPRDLLDRDDHVIRPRAFPTTARDADGMVIVTFPDGTSVRCAAENLDRLSAQELIHCNAAIEENGNDAWGLQGGQGWRAPTPAPSAGAPSWHPTLGGDPFALRGTVYYDANLNGRRDANVDGFVALGPDAEYRYGLGGVTLALLECSRSYFIHATAPEGYLFSGGVCNDRYEGWGCEYTSAEKFALGFNRWLRRNGLPPTRDLSEQVLGIREGRSEKCVSIDRQGFADSKIDLGVIRIGDARFEQTDVELALDFKSNSGTGNVGPGRGRTRGLLRSLVDGALDRIIQDKVLDSIPQGDSSYMLPQRDKEAIGDVTAEVLATRLDERLLKNGVVIGKVSPISVVYVAPEFEQVEPAEDYGNSTDNASDMNRRTQTEEAAAPPPRSRKGRTGRLSIKVSVSGHFSRDLNVDFDYIVQDSINRDTAEVRKRLLTYNDNCRSQSVKVNTEGFTIDDFSEVHKNTGVEKPRSNLNMREQQKLEGKLKNEQAFSTSCERELVLPEYFETSLGAIKVKTELGTYVVDESGISPLLVAIIALVVGLFALCTGYFLWQRGREEKAEEDYFEDTPSMQDPTNVDKSKQNIMSYEEEIQQYEHEMSSRKEVSKEGRRIGMMTSLDDSTIPTILSEHSPSRKQRGHGGSISEKSASMRGNPQRAQSFSGSVASYASRNAVPRVINMGPDGGSASERDSRSSRELFKMTVGARSDRRLYDGSGGGGSRSFGASQRSVSSRSSLPARGLANISEEGKSPKSRNAVPKIARTDYEDSEDDTRSSGSSSSSSSS